MIISDEKLTEFQRIYKEVKGKDISREDAYDQGMKLIRMVKLIYYDLTEEEHQSVEKNKFNIFLQKMKQMKEQKEASEK